MKAEDMTIKQYRLLRGLNDRGGVLYCDRWADVGEYWDLKHDGFVNIFTTIGTYEGIVRITDKGVSFLKEAP